MVCSLDGTMSTFIESCNDTEMNSTFNFSLDEVYSILMEHKRDARNLDQSTETILIAVYLGLIIAGLTANLTVIYVIARRAQMHTSRNIYIVNLAISDITLCLVCMPFTLTSIIRYQWNMGSFVCKLVPLLQGTNIMVSVGTITVIAIDRYWVIVRGSAQNERRSVYVAILLVWLFAVITTLPIPYYQVVEPLTFHQIVLYESCLEKWPTTEIKVAYNIAIVLIQAVLPATVLLVVHIRIATFLHTHTTSQKDPRRALRELQRNKRTTLLLIGVAVVFTVSWLPLSVFSLTADLMTTPVNPRQLYLTLAVCHITAMTSAISNPIIYGWMNSNIRNELYQLFNARLWGTQNDPRSIVTGTTALRNRSRPLIMYNTSNYTPGSQEIFSRGVTVL
ncbi:neuropeptide F receptor-like [Daktulosphaira vitifoliae]|uniref:neuropeptide F receptor-like n=1 Tax=Daktulosphaira vitifoliae TaxID=58002 RepID=UPI0021A9BFBA|nr:neuropeptide F receptor-like [Daktulosphaira vitifoliae]XP_050549050.1 neuropeptide F receptor-like [Daktulosphaira vitifoliae]XP_050549052.1 neuropeptide F receptor-like [Daktulosphaira vitifoliae]XP_050549053.1 neuropeptide F receptor-like [Daktulosphaira vitifoliae]